MTLSLYQLYEIFQTRYLDVCVCVCVCVPGCGAGGVRKVRICCVDNYAVPLSVHR